MIEAGKWYKISAYVRFDHDVKHVPTPEEIAKAFRAIFKEDIIVADLSVVKSQEEEGNKTRNGEN